MKKKKIKKHSNVLILKCCVFHTPIIDFSGICWVLKKYVAFSIKYFFYDYYLSYCDTNCYYFNIALFHDN